MSKNYIYIYINREFVQKFENIKVFDNIQKCEVYDSTQCFNNDDKHYEYKKIASCAFCIYFLQHVLSQNAHFGILYYLHSMLDKISTNGKPNIIMWY